MNHPSPSFDARPAPVAPATFHLKYRWPMLGLGAFFIAFMLFIVFESSTRIRPIQLFNLVPHIILIVQALTWRVVVAPDGLQISEGWSTRRYAWADFSHIEALHIYGRRVVCLVHQQHVPDVSGWGRWWLPAHLRRRCTSLAGHWADFEQIERLALAYAPQLAGAPAGAWLVPPAPAVRSRQFWFLVGLGFALVLALIATRIILF